MEKNREAKYEYLRIFSIILIIMAHYAGHGGLAEIDIMNSNKLIGSFLEIGGKLGANLFVLISGYFLINSKFRVKRLIKIDLQVIFYSILSIILVLIFFDKQPNIKEIIKSFLPVTYSLYWFVTTYIGMYILTPFINKLVNSINKDNYKELLIILFIFVSVLRTIIPGSNIYSSNLILFIFLYLLAGYINKYDISVFKNRNYMNIIIAILIYIFIFVVQVICMKISEKYSIFNVGISFLRSGYTIPQILISIYLFMFFKNSNLKGNKILFLFAKSSFGVYLLHDNLYLKTYLWKNILHVEDYYYSTFITLLMHIIGSVFIIYIIGTIIELIRINTIEKIIFKIDKIDKICDKIDEKFDF